MQVYVSGDIHTYRVGTCMLRRWEFVHIAQCRGFVTSGSNHWILRQPDLVSKTETLAWGTGEVITGCRN